MLRVNTEERRKLYCIVFCAFCQGFWEGLIKLVICLATLPFYVLCLCFCGYGDSNDREHNGEHDRIIYSNPSESDSESEYDSDSDSSKWVTARSLGSLSIGGDKDKFEELKPLIF